VNLTKIDELLAKHDAVVVSAVAKVDARLEAAVEKAQRFNDVFEEGKHPRDEGGKFAPEGGRKVPLSTGHVASRGPADPNGKKGYLVSHPKTVERHLIVHGPGGEVLRHYQTEHYKSRNLQGKLAPAQRERTVPLEKSEKKYKKLHAALWAAEK